MKWYDYLYFFGLLLVLASLCVALIFYYNIEYRECINSPLIYGAKNLEEKFGYNFSGFGSFNVINSPTIYFTSKEIRLEYINSPKYDPTSPFFVVPNFSVG